MAGAVSGCAVTGSAITYRYDNFNRLISYENGSITAQYAYDGEDYRIRKTVSDAAGTKETRYFYEGNQVAYEADASGNLTAHNVYGTTLISQTGEADNSIRYAGYQYDLETGLYYVNARYYNSTTGRFITEDTYIGKYYDPLSLNRYTYCHNNPLRYTNPSGHGLFSSLALKFLGGAVFGAVAEVVSQKLFEKKEKIDWKAVAYEAVVGGVSAAVGGVIGKKLASKTTGSATKKIVKSAVAAGVSESSSGFATDVGKQIFVEDKKLDEVDYGQAAKTASIAGIAGIAGAILGAYKECISGYRLETKQRKVKRYSVRYQCFNAIENCPNHPNYPVVTGVREQMETYQEWVYVGKEYADDLADSTKKGITKAAKSTDTVKKAAEKKAASTIQDGAAETVTKKESLLDRVKKWWENKWKRTKEISFGEYSTKIDSKVTVVKKQKLPEDMVESFKDSNYRTVVTNEDITVYRVFGYSADAGGRFTTSKPALNRTQAKIDSALLPKWKNSIRYEAKIIVPKGTTLNIGRVEEQFTKSGTRLAGDADQIILPLGWDLSWIENIRNVKP